METRLEVRFIVFRPISGSILEWTMVAGIAVAGAGSRCPAEGGSCSGIMRAGFGVREGESIGRLLRSRGKPTLVRLLSPPVERSTTRDEGAGLWRLRRCSGRVRRGYSSRVSTVVVRGRRLSASSGCWTGMFGRARVRGEELTGFHRREAGGRREGLEVELELELGLES